MLISAWQSAWAVGVYICNEIRVWMRVYTAICLLFLFHTSTISSKSLFVSFYGDSMTIFIKLDRLSSVKWLRRLFFINFMSEKLCSADAVKMRIDKYMVASLCRLGNNAISMSLVSNSFSCMNISSFSCVNKELMIHFPLCAEVRRDNGCLLKFNSFQWFTW